VVTVGPSFRDVAWKVQWNSDAPAVPAQAGDFALQTAASMRGQTGDVPYSSDTEHLISYVSKRPLKGHNDESEPLAITEDLMGHSGTAARLGSDNTVAPPFETVADILERQLYNVITEWLRLVEKEPDLTAIPMDYQERTGHLPQLLHDVIARLRMDEGSKAPISEAAGHHGDLRSKQGYTVAMAVEESRLLQVSIFSTLHKSQSHLDFSALLPAIVTIADEVDAQLKQQMLRFMAADEAKAVDKANAAHTM